MDKRNRGRIQKLIIYDRSTYRNAGAFIFAINEKQAGKLTYIPSCIGEVSSVDMSLYSHYHNCPFRQRRSPLWWLRHHLYPKGSMSLDSQVSNVPLRIQFAGVTPVPLPPPEELGTLWVFSSLLDDTKGKRREACSAPCIGWKSGGAG